MKRYKITIRKKIFFSHISVVVLCSLLIFISFNLCLNFYIEKDMRTELVHIAKSIEKIIVNSSNDKFEDNFYIKKNISKIDEFLNNKNSMFNINYAILNQNNKLLYPEKKNTEAYEFVENNIISVINEKKLIASKKAEKTDFYFNALGEQYQAVIYPLKSSNNINKEYLIIYSDLIKTSWFVSVVNKILVIILGITIVFSVIISNNLSKKISYPISQLSNYAKKIGERKYDVVFMNYGKRDEIGQLAETMKNMSQKLSKYHNNMIKFMQNASHEMRTPLMSIQGYAEGIKYGVVDDKDKAVSIIIEESKRLSLLVDDLLYLSKIEMTEDNFNIEEFNLEQFIYSTIEKVSGIAVKNGKTINFLEHESTITFLGDKEKLTRAIINVIGNCLRYCKQNVDIILKNENAKIVIIIEDDGPGFDKNQIQNIFDRFFKGKGGNYGLGLTITKSIIERHSGTIVAENKVNGGARFKITF